MIDFELFENDKGMREVHLAGVYVCCRLQPWCNSWKQLLISEVEAVELSSAQRMTDDWVFDPEKSYLIITFLLSFTSDSALIGRICFFNWSITALQCCVSFCCTRWIIYRCTSVIVSFASLLFPSDYFLLFLVEDNTHPSLYAFQTNSVDEKVLYGSFNAYIVCIPWVYARTSLVAQIVKSPAMQEAWIWSLGWEDPLRRAWRPTPAFLPGEPPWPEEPGRLQTVGLHSVGNEWLSKAHVYANQTHRTILKSSVPLNCFNHQMVSKSPER